MDVPDLSKIDKSLVMDLAGVKGYVANYPKKHKEVQPLHKGKDKTTLTLYTSPEEAVKAGRAVTGGNPSSITQYEVYAVPVERKSGVRTMQSILQNLEEESKPKVATKKRAKKVATKKAVTKKTATRSAPAKKVATKKAVTKKTATRSAPAKKVTTKKTTTPVKKAVVKKRTAKQVNPPVKKARRSKNSETSDVVSQLAAQLQQLQEQIAAISKS